MAIYRTVSISFWSDSKVTDDFTPEDRYFYLYLFTNPHTSLSGCYEISIKQMALELGYSQDTCNRLIERFISIHNVIRHSKETKEILLLNWHKYNWTESPKFKKALVREIEKVKNPIFKGYLTRLANGENAGYGIDTTCIDTSVPVTDTVTVTDTVSVKGGMGGIEIIQNSSCSLPVKEKLIEFLRYREEIKKPYPESSLRILVKETFQQEQRHDTDAIVKLIEESIRNGWQGIFFDRLERQQAQKINPHTQKLIDIGNWGKQFEQQNQYGGFPDDHPGADSSIPDQQIYSG